jgi:hypothetical protein
MIKKPSNKARAGKKKEVQHPHVYRVHGCQPRGTDFHPASTLFEGRFGRMFRTLPPARFDEADLKNLAEAMIAKHEAKPTPETKPDDEENQGISAGYTYLGQFIDHDLTFDPASSLQKDNDPDALVDFRTPRFDLDSVYGRGPDDQPYLYQDDGVHMLLGRRLTGNPHDRHTRDVPRNTPRPGSPARALTGDPRNDENVIVSQLQATVLRFHNWVADFLPRQKGQQHLLKDPKRHFEAAQRQVRWHYQWIVVEDFLRTIAGDAVVDSILPHLKKKTNITVDKPDLKFFRWEREPYIPIEFSAAAYRFGHSMVRPIYRLNTTLRNRIDIFSPDHESLRGFRAFPKNFAIDWSLFFELRSDAPTSGPERLQKSYKIDTSLVNPLGTLPGFTDRPSLAERNLIRGWRMGLPSGQAAARHMHLDVIEDKDLKVGKATEDDYSKNPRITKVSPNFRDNAPLWYYILAEAAQRSFDGHNETTIRLGPVGGRIVAEVFIGLLVGDTHSFLHHPDWQPIEDFKSGGKFAIEDLIKQAMQAR